MTRGNTMNTRRGCALVVVAAAVTLTGCGPSPQHDGNETVLGATATHVLVVPASSHVTGGPYPTTCHRAPGDDQRLPVRACTPGAIRSDVDPTHLELTVCKPGWSDTIRPPTSETNRLKTAAMTAYVIPPTARPTTELDHDVPEALGGASDVENLWPQVSDQPGAGTHNTKDGVELKVHIWVCHGHQAQWAAAVQAFAVNWTTTEQTLRILP